MALSQEKKVLKHLQEHGSITSWEAIHRYKVTRLSSVIHILRHKRGCNIVTYQETSKRGKPFGRYELIQS
jgi:hypothetical protein